MFRRGRAEFIDAQIEQEIAASKTEIKELKAEHNQSVGEAKAKFQAKIDTAQKRLESQQNRIKERIEAIKREGDAKLKVFQEQNAKAKGELKVKLEKRIAEARADHEKRVDKLSKAWQLVKEAAAT